MYSIFLVVAFVVCFVLIVWTVFKSILIGFSILQHLINKVISIYECSTGSHDYQPDEYKLRLKSEVHMCCVHCGKSRFVRYIDDWEYEHST